MSSLKQIQANRRNALKSTTTPEGKQRLRCNAVRQGLTAETVIAALESAEDYEAFAAAVISDYDAERAVERELSAMAASPHWPPLSEKRLFGYRDVISIGRGLDGWVAYGSHCIAMGDSDEALMVRVARGDLRAQVSDTSPGRSPALTC